MSITEFVFYELLDALPGIQISLYFWAIVFNFLFFYIVIKEDASKNIMRLTTTSIIALFLLIVLVGIITFLNNSI